MRLGDRAFRSSGFLVCVLVGVFMLVPAVTVLVLSFANGTELVFPPTSWGLRQYHSFFTGGVWLPAIVQSLKVGIPVSLIAVAVGVPAALGLQRTRLPRAGIVRAVGLAPLVLPAVAYAVAMYGFLSQIGIIGTYWGLVLADCMLVLPFVVIVVEAALSRIPRDLELVAMSLGASPAAGDHRHHAPPPPPGGGGLLPPLLHHELRRVCVRQLPRRAGARHPPEGRLRLAAHRPRPVHHGRRQHPHDPQHGHRHGGLRASPAAGERLMRRHPSPKRPAAPDSRPAQATTTPHGKAKR